MNRKKRRNNSGGNDGLLAEIHKKAGRALLPPNRVFRGGKEYSRKLKHKRSDYQDDSCNHSFFIY